MLNRDSFLQLVAAAKGEQSDVQISQLAGLRSNALANIRSGKVPSLERAAKLADAVGLELVVRPKGEAIQSLALRLALLDVFVSLPMDSYDVIDDLADRVLNRYRTWHGVFEDAAPDEHEATFDAARNALLYVSKRLHSADVMAVLERSTIPFELLLKLCLRDPDEE